MVNATLRHLNGREPATTGDAMNPQKHTMSVLDEIASWIFDRIIENLDSMVIPQRLILPSKRAHVRNPRRAKASLGAGHPIESAASKRSHRHDMVSVPPLEAIAPLMLLPVGPT